MHVYHDVGRGLPCCKWERRRRAPTTQLLGLLPTGRVCGSTRITRSHRPPVFHSHGRPCVALVHGPPCSRSASRRFGSERVRVLGFYVHVSCVRVFACAWVCAVGGWVGEWVAMSLAALVADVLCCSRCRMVSHTRTKSAARSSLAFTHTAPHSLPFCQSTPVCRHQTRPEVHQKVVSILTEIMQVRPSHHHRVFL